MLTEGKGIWSSLDRWWKSEWQVKIKTIQTGTAKTYRHSCTSSTATTRTDHAVHTIPCFVRLVSCHSCWSVAWYKINKRTSKYRIVRARAKRKKKKKKKIRRRQNVLRALLKYMNKDPPRPWNTHTHTHTRARARTPSTKQQQQKSSNHMNINKIFKYICKLAFFSPDLSLASQCGK